METGFGATVCLLEDFLLDDNKWHGLYKKSNATIGK